MLYVKDIQTCYYIMLAYLLTMVFGESVRSYVETGSMLDIEILTWAFAYPGRFLMIWIYMFCNSMLVIWITKFAVIAPRPVWLTVYVVYQIMTYAVPSILLLNIDIGVSTGIAVQCEMARFSMKQHAYIREKLLFGMKGNPYADYVPNWIRGFTLEELNIPNITISDTKTELSRYLYFSFAPTLMYRDAYPRLSQEIRWQKVTICGLNVLLSIIYTWILFLTQVVPYFRATYD
jgi:sterol O-acyltransferase